MFERMGKNATIQAQARVGESYFLALIGTQLALVMLVAPAFTAAAICLDRARGALAQVLVTDLTDAEIVLGKLALANWRSWPSNEQQVLEDLVDAWFECALSRDIAHFEEGWFGWESESVLCGAARAGLPLERWLVRLQDPAAAAVLTELKQRFPHDRSGFWDDAPAGFRELSTILSQGQA